MVNYRRVVCDVALVAALVALAAAAPAPDVHYDQRQNGTENYRLNIDGVVIAIAPAESLLAAASDIDLGDLLDLDYFDFPKPSSKPPHEPVLEPKPEEQSKPEDQKLKPEKEEKPSLEEKPKPQEEPAKPETAAGNLKSYPHGKGQKKDGTTRKQSRLRNYMYSILGSLMKNRHHQAANQ